MPSPFPGMDPYLEGYLWVDVHNALASKIRQQLVPKLRPRYTRLKFIRGHLQKAKLGFSTRMSKFCE